ncbi:glycosyltransferase family 2 protein [Nocardioides solisilvae]|uniref:glycosyltransferase family 2 protein n=1 Tax=Nocardioides solisilvae TaxID=1542435 RepID=UPI000D74242D|nr:glycosyltransferase family 2 protein [Nocardioides solisilvae]
MLLTASTVLDRPANVEHFVRSNLALGVDHMVVFLDSPRAEGQDEVRAWLDSVPQVTAVPAGRDWWRGERPAGLNVRQRINANAVVRALADQPWASWVFHLDGDEVFAGDRRVLDALPATTAAAWLTPLEAVSEPDPPRRPVRFKRLLDDADLNLLHVLGVIGAPTNGAYFHGHVLGKSGVRPASGLRLTLHEAVDAEGGLAPRAEDPALRVLHYDAVSGAEFVRKWTAMLGAGPARFRPDRAPVAEALRALVGRDLPPEVAERHLRRIYDATTRDDVTTLDELGLLVEVDPARGGHRPAPLDEAQRAALEAGLARVAAEPKRGLDAQKRRTRSGAPASEGRPSRWARAVSRRRDDG